MLHSKWINIILYIYLAKIVGYYAFDEGCSPSEFPKALGACIGKQLRDLTAEKANIKKNDVPGLAKTQCNYETKKIECEKESTQKARKCFFLTDDDLKFIYSIDEDKYNYLCGEDMANMTVIFKTPAAAKCFLDNEKCEEEYLGDNVQESRNWIKTLVATQVCAGLGSVWSCRYERSTKCEDKRARSMLEDVRVIGLSDIPDCSRVLENDFPLLLSENRFPYDPADDSELTTEAVAPTKSSIETTSLHTLLFWLIILNMVLF